MATRFVERMCIEIDGQGEPLVMVHGLGGTSNTFTPVIEGIGRQMQVIRPDLPGCGRSPTSGRLSTEEFADAVVRALTTLGMGRANFAGHSMGTIICFHIALRNPRLVKSLALVGPLLAPADAGRQSLRDRAATARSQGMQPIADTIVQATTAGATRRERPVAVALIREMLMRQDAEGYARACEALADAAPPDVAPIKCPALLLTGDEDPIATATGARAIARQMSGSSTRVLGKCGHWATLERPEETASALEEFLLKRH
jgi:pimeloyl-ACP methyl ester carboxylesterase